MDATYYAAVKRLLNHASPYAVMASIHASAALFLFLLSVWKGIPQLGPNFMASLAGMILFNLAGTFLYVKALQTTDISLVIPMLSFTPVFLVLTSLIVLGESASGIGILGIGSVAVGAYILHAENADALSAPFKEPAIFHRMIGALFMVGRTILIIIF